MAKKKFNGVISKDNKAGGKLNLPKSFEIGHFKFIPCNYTVSKKAGFRYFLLCRDSMNCIKCEKLSPRFKDKEEAEAFVLNNKDYSLRPV